MDGSTKIRNEVLEKLYQIRIPGEATQLLFYIMRHTWGHGKFENKINFSQLSIMGMNNPAIVRARKKLEAMKIIITKKDNDGSVIYRINRELREWEGLPKKITTPIDMTDEFLNELKPLYPHVNVDSEVLKMRAWLLTPKGRGRRLTKGFVVRWLNRFDAPPPATKPPMPAILVEKPPSDEERERGLMAMRAAVKGLTGKLSIGGEG